MPLVPYLLGASLEELACPAAPALFRAAGPQRAVRGPGHGHGHGHVHPWRHSPLLTHFLHSPPHPHGARVAPAAARQRPGAFKVNLDVQQFTPDEIDIKIVNNFVVVEAKHEERPDEHGLISREFQRRYKIPDDVDIEEIISKLSSDGVLTIEAPKKSSKPPTKEQKIPITQTHAPAVTEQHFMGTNQPQQQGKASLTEKMDQ